MEYRIKDIGRTNDAEVPLPMTLRVLARNLAGRSVPILSLDSAAGDWLYLSLGRGGPHPALCTVHAARLYAEP